MKIHLFHPVATLEWYVENGETVKLAHTFCKQLITKDVEATCDIVEYSHSNDLAEHHICPICVQRMIDAHDNFYTGLE